MGVGGAVDAPAQSVDIGERAKAQVGEQMSMTKGTSVVSQQAEELYLLQQEVERLREALQRIAHAKPDGLDHSRDVAIIERAANVARAALGEGK